MGEKKVKVDHNFSSLSLAHPVHVEFRVQILSGKGFFVFSATPAITSESVPPGWITWAFLLPSDSKNEIKATVSVLFYFKSRRLNLAWSK